MPAMRTVFVAVGVSLAVVGLAGAAGSLAACNAVLGIDEATPEPTTPTGGEGGAPDGGVRGDAGLLADGAIAFVAKDDCADYCNDIGVSCSATTNQEYLSTDVCQQLCAFHANHYDEQGLNGPVDVSATSQVATGDSVYCRVWHSHAALEDPVEHCPHAGPLGALFCGTNPCDDFCSMAVQFCGAMSYPGPTGMADCLQACNPSADGGYAGYPYLIGDASDLQASGNTLNCRIYHLENYLFTKDPVHCAHIVSDGGGVCVDPSP